MPEVKVGDINLHYELYGKGDPVIFAHAFWTTAPSGRLR